MNPAKCRQRHRQQQEERGTMAFPCSWQVNGYTLDREKWWESDSDRKTESMWRLKFQFRNLRAANLGNILKGWFTGFEETQLILISWPPPTMGTGSLLLSLLKKNWWMLKSNKASLVTLILVPLLLVPLVTGTILTSPAGWKCCDYLFYFVHVPGDGFIEWVWNQLSLNQPPWMSKEKYPSRFP